MSSRLPSGLFVTTFGTLLSRVLGLARDIATASLLGMSAGGVMDALVFALRIPSMFRRLFGEGALMAAYLPQLTTALERDRSSAWRLASTFLLTLSGALLVLLVAAELSVLMAWTFYEADPRTQLALSLTAILLPYLMLLCITAQLAASLHALSHFSTPALSPIIINICWLIAACLIAPWAFSTKESQAYCLAGCIVFAGALQMLVQGAALRSYGFRWSWNWTEHRTTIKAIAAATLPAVLGLAATQINTLSDSLLAWLLSGQRAGQEAAWLGGLPLPLSTGAAAATYFGERLYMFPMGLIGASTATVYFPLLTRHAARGEWSKIGKQLMVGVRLVLLLGLPATVGLTLLAEPIARLLFERGEFNASDTARTGRVIAAYALGVWAFCAAPLLARAFFAIGDHRTPLRIGMMTIGLNIVLGLSLVWTRAEAGLALATAASGIFQTIALAVAARGPLELRWSRIAATFLRSVVACGVMTASILAVQALVAAPPSDQLLWRVAPVAGPIAAAIPTYFVVLLLIGSDLRRIRRNWRKSGDLRPTRRPPGAVDY